ncbi:response regulator [Halobacillus sp. ACCC02827]|uniref:response regulator n=1 Tax=Bacillaceae TaxID=186817 RepID=UPI00040EEF8D|nr:MULTISPECIES: response regulator [Bacillaceae]QHT47730.1 response regulator [Bacillus sp. SB49]WJE14970.1 response regulator [Halobacillus sp. ACCC02827]
MSVKPVINVLLIEDDPMVQEVNRQFIEQVTPFQVIATAGNGREGVELAEKLSPDLIVLDVYMPEKDGKQTIKEIRAHAFPSDIIVISAAKEKETVRAMLRYGVHDYIMKPFKFERLQQALLSYHSYYSKTTGEGDLGQDQLDTFLKREKKTRNETLPKGLNEKTLEQVQEYIQSRSEALSAEEVSDGLGMARVTARRYLEYLQKQGVVTLDLQYGGVGRPVNRYRYN